MKRLGRALAMASAAAPIVVLLAGWELLTRTGVISTRVLPTFSSVCAAGADLIASGTLLHHLIVSLYRALGGLGLSILSGVVLGFGMATSRPIQNFFDPIVSLLYPLPKTALVPLTMVWLGMTDRAAILVVFLAGLLPIVRRRGVRALAALRRAAVGRHETFACRCQGGQGRLSLPEQGIFEQRPRGHRAGGERPRDGRGIGKVGRHALHQFVAAGSACLDRARRGQGTQALHRQSGQHLLQPRGIS